MQRAEHRWGEGRKDGKTQATMLLIESLSIVSLSLVQVQIVPGTLELISVMQQRESRRNLVLVELAWALHQSKNTSARVFLQQCRSLRSGVAMDFTAHLRPIKIRCALF